MESRVTMNNRCIRNLLLCLAAAALFTGCDEGRDARAGVATSSETRASVRPIAATRFPGTARAVTPTSSTQVVYNGGPVISNVEVHAVFWGATGIDATVKSQIPDFYETATNSSYLDWLLEYNTS